MFFGTKELTIYDAHEYYLDGKYQKALDLCEKILTMYPDRYSALNLIANIYFINGDFEKGEHYIYKLRDHFLKKKEYAKAVAVIKRLLTMCPDKVEYYHQITDIYEEAGDKKGLYRSSLEAADILRKTGYFKDASNVYLAMGAHFRRPAFLISLLNKIIALGEAEKACELAKRYILPSDSFTSDEKDEVIGLCVKSGCHTENFTEYMPTGTISDITYEDAVYEQEVFDIDSHAVLSEYAEVTPLELDVYNNKGDLNVDSDLKGLETFEHTVELMTIDTPENMESHLMGDAPYSFVQMGTDQMFTEELCLLEKSENKALQIEISDIKIDKNEDKDIFDREV